MTDTAPAPPLGLRRDRFAPAPEVTAMREQDDVCPVTTLVGHPATLVAGYRAARTVHGDPRLGFGGVPAPPGTEVGADETELTRRRAGMLLALDPPDHQRLRRMLSARFTLRAVERLRPRIEGVVDEALDGLVADGRPADLVSRFALPVPSLVICELLGVPYADRDAFQARAERTLESGLPPAERVAILRASLDYMHTLIARARREPGDDLIGHLVAGFGDRPPSEGGIDDDELAGLANLLLVAGHETTSNLIAMGTLAVLETPAQLDALRVAVAADDAGDPKPLRTAVEELLRYLSPVSAGFPRMATEDVDVDGHTIAAGTMVTASLCAANRDPALGDGLDELDVTRPPVPHVAFGYGLHHCLGAQLARLELTTAFGALLRRLPGIALAEPADAVAMREQALIHGLHALRVTW